MHNTLSRLLSPQELHTFEDCFRFALEHSVEPELIRKDDAFNPLPGRLVQILIRECNERNSLTLLAAILLAAEPSILSTTIFPDDLANKAKALALSASNSASVDYKIENERLLLARDLDNARHLHMQPISQDKKSLVAKDLLARKRTFAENQRLVELLGATIERFFKHTKETA